MAVLEVNHVKKVYSTRFGAQKVEALADVSFNVEQGEYVAIMGESGSGKTTLLNILAALDKPTAGSVLLAGRDLTAVKDRELAAFRRDMHLAAADAAVGELNLGQFVVGDAVNLLDDHQRAGDLVYGTVFLHHNWSPAFSAISAISRSISSVMAAYSAT